MNTDNTLNDGIERGAISLYGQNEGIDDFPVLKAFQQYIDAEQEKARKRIVSLSIVFGVVLFFVMAVFLFIVLGISRQNQSLNDRFLEYTMKTADSRYDAMVVASRQTASPSQANSDSALKELSDTLVALKQTMMEKDKSNVRRDVSQENVQKNSEEAEKLRQAKELLEIEKKKLSEEKERLRQLEIEQQRRKLYPDCYNPDGSFKSPSPKAQNNARTLTDEDIREIIREAYCDDAEKERKSNMTHQDRVKNDNNDNGHEMSNDVIDYFKDDEYSIPIDVKNSPSKIKFTVPVD